MKNCSSRLVMAVVAGMVAFSCFAAAAQQAGEPAQQNAAPGAPVRKVQLTAVQTELQSKLDAKTAKVGDNVVMKTKSDVKTADGTDIPKGTRLMGHVTDVQTHDATNADSRLGVQLDRAELKGGQSLPILSVIASATQPVDASPSGMMSPSPGPGSGSPGGAPSGGGSGHPGGSSGGTTTGESSVPQPMTSSSQSTSNDAAANAGKTVQIQGTNGTITARTTGVPGVLLASAVTGSNVAPASGMFFAVKKNVRLDDGTQFVLGIADIGGK